MLINNVGSIANRLQYDFDNISSLVNHPVVKGNMREAALRSSLRDLLPKKYDIGTGIILDAHGTQSRQQDFIVYDGFSSPCFLKDESTVILPVESVYATVEVKSTLNKKELERAVENASSVKRLKKSLLCTPTQAAFQGSNYIYSTIFAYTSDLGLDSLKKRFDEVNKDIPHEHRISTICVLSEGCILSAHACQLEMYNTQPSAETLTQSRRMPMDETLYMYYILLQYHLSTAISFPPNLVEYTNVGKALKPTQLTVDVDSIKAAGFVANNGVVFAAEDVERFQRYAAYLDRELTEEIAAREALSLAELHKEVDWARTWFIQKNNEIRRSQME